MESETGLIALGGLIFAYALVGKSLAKSIVTAPVLFLAAGFALNAAGIISLDHGEEGLHILAEVSLVVLLFADAAVIDVRALARGATKPARMLFLGLPIMVALGFLAGLLLLWGWPLWEIALIAAILAPTDAALSQAIIANTAVPEHIRRTLSAESGLNDGLALPFVVFFGCFAVGGIHDAQQLSWWVFVGEQIGFGILVGLAVGLAGGFVLRAAQSSGLSSASFGGIAVLALAGLAYLLSTAVHGNGFLATFVAGMAFGTLMQGRGEFVFEFMETEGQLLTVLSFFVIGAVLLPEGLPHVTPAMVILVLLSLFVLRPVAIAASLIGTGTSRLETFVYGWFGPRGLATALFALVVLQTFDGLKMNTEILAISSFAVLASAILHGATAAPAGRLFRPRRS